MSDSVTNGVSRREFVQGTLSGALLAAGSGAVLAAGSANKDKQTVLAQIPQMHSANVKRLQGWIALPSIAAENRNYPQGAQYLAGLPAAGFGLGHGTGAHAPDEYYLIDSTNPQVQGLDGAIGSFVGCLYALA